MNHMYYVMDGASKTGPFDIMSMMKKIRTQRIDQHTLIYVDDADDPIEAFRVPELQEFFSGDNSQEVVFQPEPDTSPLDLIACLRDAWTFFSRNQAMIIVSAVLVLSIGVLGLVLSAILPAIIISILMSVLGGAAYFFYLYYILQVVRTHDLAMGQIVSILKSGGARACTAGAVAAAIAIGTPSVIGAAVSSFAYLFVIPGFILFSLFVMAPFFMSDNPEMDYKTALKTSFNWVKTQGVDNMGVIVGLVFLNMIGSMVLFFPILVTLPVTAIALADIYERRIRGA